MKRRTRMQVQSGLLAMVLATSACAGNDADRAAEDATTSEATPDTTATEAAAGGEDAAAFCDHWTEVQATVGDVPPEETITLAEAAKAAAPEDIAAAIQTEIELFSSGDADFQLDPEFIAAEEAVDTHLLDVCDADTTIDVTGTEYAFDGVPDEVAAGLVKLRFSNDGVELHEAVHLVKKPGVTESWDELLQLPEEEARTKVDFVGGGFALPGSFDAGIHDWKPGEYLLICFLPEGATPEVVGGGEEPQGAPHFTLGMKHEFVVR